MKKLSEEEFKELNLLKDLLVFKVIEETACFNTREVVDVQIRSKRKQFKSLFLLVYVKRLLSTMNSFS